MNIGIMKEKIVANARAVVIALYNRLLFFNGPGRGLQR